MWYVKVFKYSELSRIQTPDININYVIKVFKYSELSRIQTPDININYVI